MDRLIGREKEKDLLKKYYNSGRPEFVAVYGRRRVGKTFMIRKFFKDNFDFYATGIIDGNRDDELKAFNSALAKYGYECAKAKNWSDAFEYLSELLRTKTLRKKRCVVFIDELPCFDTQNSGFVKAFDYFWNSSGSWINNIFLIICGSATSWMIRNVINNRGGLHNRITHEIHLRPFDLCNVEKFCKACKSKWDRLSILQAYTALGGVPYYWGLLDFERSVADNIDTLFFSGDGELSREYRRLFSSLFRNPDGYIDIINLLSDNKQGLTRRQIAEQLKIADNGFLGNRLEDLVNCDFIRVYNNGSGKVNGGIYQVIDFFTLFHRQFCRRNQSDIHFWRNALGSSKQNNWYGLAYERVCMFHINHIIKALHLDSISTEFYSWRSKKNNPAAQIDIVIDRADGMITICKVKYSRTKYTLSKSEYEKILNRIDAFSVEHDHLKGIQTVMVTTMGLKSNTYSEISQISVTLNDLFNTEI